MIINEDFFDEIKADDIGTEEVVEDESSSKFRVLSTVSLTPQKYFAMGDLAFKRYFSRMNTILHNCKTIDINSPLKVKFSFYIDNMLRNRNVDGSEAVPVSFEVDWMTLDNRQINDRLRSMIGGFMDRFKPGWNSETNKERSGTIFETVFEAGFAFNDNIADIELFKKDIEYISDVAVAYEYLVHTTSGYGSLTKIDTMFEFETGAGEKFRYGEALPIHNWNMKTVKKMYSELVDPEMQPGDNSDTKNNLRIKSHLRKIFRVCYLFQRTRKAKEFGFELLGYILHGSEAGADRIMVRMFSMDPENKNSAKDYYDFIKENIIDKLSEHDKNDIMCNSESRTVEFDIITPNDYRITPYIKKQYNHGYVEKLNNYQEIRWTFKMFNENCIGYDHGQKLATDLADAREEFQNDKKNGLFSLK